LSGRRVGVQLYGSEPNLPLMQFLQHAGACVLPVAPYVYSGASAARQCASGSMLKSCR
jgi:uroporphyrinogen-III synthase